jgi:hypothetical protein
MDTFIWGPSTWKILHTLSFAPPHLLKAHQPHILGFMDSLKDVLPCVYCRTSYEAFLTQMPDLGATIQNEQFPRWMFDLHSKVNSKLGVKDPEFPRVQKRFTIRPKQWCPGDVWDLIALFGINYSQEKSGMYRKWWENLLPVLLVAGADQNMMRLLSMVDCPCDNGQFMATSLMLSSAYNSTSLDWGAIQKRIGEYNLAKAKTCANGGCK